MIHSSNSFFATRYKTGGRDRPNDCMMIELRGDAITHFQYLSAADNTYTPHYRYSQRFNMTGNQMSGFRGMLTAAQVLILPSLTSLILTDKLH